MANEKQPTDQSIKNKLFLSTKDKDDVQRERCEDDFELSEEAKVNFPKYSPKLVLKSFAEKDEKTNRKLFSKTWEKMKHNIIGQTIWIALIYLFFYYLFQILVVQQAIDTSKLLYRNRTKDGNISDPTCTTNYCKCYINVINATFANKATDAREVKVTDVTKVTKVTDTTETTDVIEVTEVTKVTDATEATLSKNETFYDEELSKCIEATHIAKFVESWAKKQKE